MHGAKLRLDRAILNLEALEASLSGEDKKKLRVFISRTSCALNTIATELTSCVGSNARSEDVMVKAADILWSFGERAADIDCQFGAPDDDRPKKVT